MRRIDLPAPVRRVPFTLLLAFTILATSAATGTLVHMLGADELAGWGFGADDLVHGRWLRLVVASFQIFGPAMALSMMATVLGMVGACEYRLGTARTVVVYTLCEVAGAVSVVLVAKLFAGLGSNWGRGLAATRELGASAGAIGTLGAWLACQPSHARRIGVASCAAFLVIAFAGEVHFWDVEHVVTFPLGLALGAFLRAREVYRDPRDTDLLRTPDARRVAVAWIAATVGVVAVVSPFAMAGHLGLAAVATWLHIDDVSRVRYAFFVSGVALLAAAPALWRGGHAAWRIALVGASLTAVGFWQPGVPGVEHVLAVLLWAALIVWRREFRLSRPARSLRSALRTGAVLPVGLAVYLGFGFLAHRQGFIPPFDARGAARATISRLRFETVSLGWSTPPAGWFLDSIPVVTYATLLAGLAGVAEAGLGRRSRPTGATRGGRAARSD